MTITHQYSQSQYFIPKSFSDAEALKNRLYLSSLSYQTGHGIHSACLQLFWTRGSKNALLPMDSGRSSCTTSCVFLDLPDLSLPAAADLFGEYFGRCLCLDLLQSSPFLNTLNFSTALLFCGSLIFFMPPTTRGPLLAHLRTLVLPPGLLGVVGTCHL